jgi:uncharacterized protein YodC (DUF2158 family)
MGHADETVELKIGELVRHKTGGPTMLIISSDTTKWACRWWDQQRGEFKIETMASCELQRGGEPC